MKQKANNLLILLFVVAYSFSCLMMSIDSGVGFFKFNSIYFQIAKGLIAFILIFILTILNKSNIDKITRYCTGYTIVLSIFFYIDACFIKITNNLYFRLIWLSIIHLSFIAVYLGVLTLKSIDFKRISTRLLKGYSILYLVSFASVFLRPLGNAATTNFIIGKGTFNFIPYLINNPSDWCIWLLTVGNVIFFIPVSFILKANFPKIKIYQQIIIGLIIPIVIEGYQFILKCGDVDIDDLVMNFCGFLIGLILLLIQNKFKKEVT